MTKHDASILVSFDEDDDTLAEAGSRIVAGRLVDHAHAVLTLAEEDEAALAPYGFGAAWRKALAPHLTELTEAKGGRVLAQSDAHPSGHAVAVELASAHKWISRFVVVTKNASRAVRESAPTIASHEHSPAAIATEIETLAAFIDTHAKDTAALGGGASFAKEGRAIATALTGKRATHTSALSKVTPAVHALHLAAGGVYLELVRASRAAHNALPAARAKLYSSESIHPARHSHHATTPPVTPAPPSTT